MPQNKPKQQHFYRQRTMLVADLTTLPRRRRGTQILAPGSTARVMGVSNASRIPFGKPPDTQETSITSADDLCIRKIGALIAR